MIKCYFYFQSQLHDAVDHLSKSKAVQEEQAKTIRELEEMAAKDEREKLKHQTHEVTETLVWFLGLAEAIM